MSLTPFIEAASQLVERACTIAVDEEGAAYYTDAELEMIERWLSAHFYQVAVTPVDSERAGSVGVGYRSKVDLGLNLTHYGQQAMMLDTAGGLKALNDQTGGFTAGMTWLGTEYD